MSRATHLVAAALLLLAAVSTSLRAAEDPSFEELPATELLRLFPAEPFWEQVEIARELVARGAVDTTSALFDLLQSEDPKARCSVGLALYGLGHDEGFQVVLREFLATAPKSEPAENRRARQERLGTRYFAALLLGEMGDSRAVPALIDATRDPTVHYQAAISLGEIGDARAAPALRQMARDFPAERHWAGYGLAKLGEDQGFDLLESVVRSDMHWTERRHAVEALGKLKASRSLPVLLEALRAPHANLRVSAAHALGALGDADAIPALEQALSDTEEAPWNGAGAVCDAAREALGAIESNATD